MSDNKGMHLVFLFDGAPSLDKRLNRYKVLSAVSQTQ